MVHEKLPRPIRHAERYCRGAHRFDARRNFNASIPWVAFPRPKFRRLRDPAGARGVPSFISSGDGGEGGAAIPRRLGRHPEPVALARRYIAPTGRTLVCMPIERIAYARKA
ncbi:hypothetical protein NX907_17810 [Burkholderia thailandensis]|uniref:hypothetical protein n=1 Tax=Burkholderia thailandensis TaxID=57975 RepID=UPI0002E9F382|nr:hypothetical protein [Burkholderia thailandensis]MCS6507459.1 hypothetical protein [Burkholderia thailandensis]MCS6518264.1 hypothetical protein [Burkholderia thailandensis]